VFPPGGIGQIQGDIDHGDGQEPGIEQVGQGKGQGDQEDACCPGSRHGQLPGGDRTVFLFGVRPVRFPVCDVVEEVNCAGQHAEQDGAGQRAQESFLVEQLAVKHQGGKNEHALGPLLGPHAFEQGLEHLRRPPGRWAC